MVVSLILEATGQVHEQLVPAHHSHYDLNSGLPDQTIRFSDIDTLGRLWIQGGRDSESNNQIFPFLFDGRTTSLIDTSNYPLPKQWESHVHGKMTDGRWFGSFLRKRESKLFIFDPISRRTITFDFGPTGQFPGYLSNAVQSTSGGIITLSVDNDYFYLCRFEGTELSFTFKSPRSVSQAQKSTDVRLPLIMHENSIWYGQLDLPVFRYDCETKELASLNAELNQIRLLEEREPPGFFVNPSGRLCYYNYGMEEIVFEFQPEERLFTPWDALPAGYHPKIYRQPGGAFSHVPQLCTSDDFGNLFFMLEDGDGNLGMILSNDNKWHDYSSVTSLALSIIGSVTSTNYLEEIRMHTNRGLDVVTIKKPIHFDHLLTEATRCILPVGDSVIYVNVPEKRGTIELNLNRKTSKVIDLKGHGYDGAFVRAQSVLINDEVWIPTASGIVVYHRAEGRIKEFISVENVGFLFQIHGEWYAIQNDRNILSIDTNSYHYRPTEYAFLDHKGKVRALKVISPDEVAVATNDGLCIMDFQENKNTWHDLSNGLLDNRVQCITKLSDGRLAIGFFGAGVQIMDFETKSSETIQVKDGLSHGIITGILEDSKANLWIATYDGLNLLDPNGRVVANLFKEDGLSTNEFNRFSFSKLGNGNLAFGSIRGVNIFNPSDVVLGLTVKNALDIYPIKVAYHDPQNDVQIENDHILGLPLEIELSPERSDYTLLFGISSYFNIEKQRFAYRFKNISPDWISLGSNNRLDLFNLAPGEYDLEIIGYDALGTRCKSPLATRIIVGEFFYRTWWFILLVISPFFIFALAWIQRNRRARVTLQLEIVKATKQIQEDKDVIGLQAAKLAKLDEQKSRFFTNISHEFRTPLTVIQGMLDLMQKDPLKWKDHGMKMIERNSDNLLNLVNQILDIRKLESGEMKLNLTQSDFGVFTGYSLEQFISQGHMAGVTLDLIKPNDDLVLDFDPDKFHSILSNLVSNAIHHTPEGGVVSVVLEKKAESLVIKVKDTGEGINPEDLPHVFDRFFRARSGTQRLGSGIGLAYVKELVLLHNGTISALSEVGQGSEFVITIPIHKSAPEQDVLPKTTSKPSVSSVHLILESLGEADESKPNLLIVEDNEDVMLYVMACLSPLYNIQVSFDGEDGYKRALSWVPDAIVSDVMMPKRDGYELCKLLKNDQRTSHIPIVLLTARVDDSSRLSGLEQGADAYLTKPFNKEELLLQVQRLIEIRATLRQKYLHFDPNSPAERVSLDDQFMVSVHQSITDHLDDSEFGIPELCEALGVSRTQLHNKLKALTGKSTSLFMRTLKIEHSCQLLITTDLTVSEVAYSVGFADPAYFSRVFTEIHGCSPSEYRNK